MDGRTDRHIDRQIDGLMEDGRMDRRTDGRMDRWTDGWMDGPTDQRTDRPTDPNIELLVHD